MSIDPEIARVLRRHVEEPSSGFSIGSSGAIAEFHRDADEPLEVCAFERLTIATNRGAISLALIDGVRSLAYETLGARDGRWRHGVVFCLPAAKAVGRCRTALTELGPDQAAVRAADRGAMLFDMGLGARNVDFCIRTGDAELLSLLRHGAGRSVAAPDSPIMRAIIDAGPHRVVLSKLGRVEVYQPIGKIKTPPGPHTHVLPKLLAGGRTHSAVIPVAKGYLPCLSLYPANPLFDSHGRDKPFEHASLAAFEALLDLWGAPEYRAEKARAVGAVREGCDPAAYEPPRTRLGRTALRIALRQMRQSEGESPHALKWRRHFDAPGSKIKA